MKCLLIQANLVWENKADNITKMEKLIASQTESPDLIVLPEMFTTGFSMSAEALAETMDDTTVRWMQEIAQKQNATVTGSCIISENGNYYNRLLWVSPSGNVAHYDKRHLFGMGDEHKFYTAGTKHFVIDQGEWKVMPMICYDLRFPVWSRNTMQADLLIFVANWPDKRIDAWSKLLQARALENQCYVIGVNRVGDDANGFHHTGHSAVIDPMGHEIDELKYTEGIIEATLDLDKIKLIRRQLPFLRDQDSFTLNL